MFLAPEVIHTRGEEASKISVRDARRGIFPVDGGQVADLVREGGGPFWLLFAVSRKCREGFNVTEKA